MVDKQTQRVICTNFSHGRRHDFRLYKESKVILHPETKSQVDTGYQGLQKLHAYCEVPKKKSKKQPLTKEDKERNHVLASERVTGEHVVGALKRFKILADRYRNRRRRFGLRFNLIAGIYNSELTI